MRVVKPFVCCRLIPAWAGKTKHTKTNATSTPAHPRVGGENALIMLDRPGPYGSSPRGRGKQDFGHAASSVRGLIPAWAGKTSSAVTLVITRPAHPRVGGENLTGAEDQLVSLGSSPRGRGKLHAVQRVAVRVGLIPAWAGKTRAWSWCRW